MTFQQRVRAWVVDTFGLEIANDKKERNHRFLEESLELVQSLGCTKEEAHMLVDYVFGRPIGERVQETGGVVVTLNALASANEIDVESAGEIELRRCYLKQDKIREKQKNKPRNSPLPEKPNQ